jgi:hypothetical protein
MDNKQKINNVDCKINDQYNLLVAIGEEDWRFPRHVMLHQQCRSRGINLYWKLYRYIFSKYSYTSLELIVRSAALTVDDMTNLASAILLGLAVTRKMKNTAPSMAMSNYS